MDVDEVSVAPPGTVPATSAAMATPSSPVRHSDELTREELLPNNWNFADKNAKDLFKTMFHSHHTDVNTVTCLQMLLVALSAHTGTLSGSDLKNFLMRGVTMSATFSNLFITDQRLKGNVQKARRDFHQWMIRTGKCDCENNRNANEKHMDPEVAKIFAVTPNETEEKEVDELLERGHVEAAMFRGLTKKTVEVWIKLRREATKVMNNEHTQDVNSRRPTLLRDFLSVLEKDDDFPLVGNRGIVDSN
jgi:hypothetical protein